MEKKNDIDVEVAVFQHQRRRLVLVEPKGDGRGDGPPNKNNKKRRLSEITTDAARQHPTDAPSAATTTTTTTISISSTQGKFDARREGSSSRRVFPSQTKKERFSFKEPLVVDDDDDDDDDAQLLLLSEQQEGGGVSDLLGARPTSDSTTAKNNHNSAATSGSDEESSSRPNDKDDTAALKNGDEDAIITDEDAEQEWDDIDLHRHFVSAIFDIGIKHSSPAVIMEKMVDTSPPNGMTSERVKSHLQKFRKSRQNEKATFLGEYDDALTFNNNDNNNNNMIETNSTTTILQKAEWPDDPSSATTKAKKASSSNRKRLYGGRAVAAVTRLVMSPTREKTIIGPTTAQSSASPFSRPPPGNSSSSNNSSSMCADYYDPGVILLPAQIKFPKMTETEQSSSSIGFSMTMIKGLLEHMHCYVNNTMRANTITEPDHAAAAVSFAKKVPSQLEKQQGAQEATRPHQEWELKKTKGDSVEQNHGIVQQDTRAPVDPFFCAFGKTIFRPTGGTAVAINDALLAATSMRSDEDWQINAAANKNKNDISKSQIGTDWLLSLPDSWFHDTLGLAELGVDSSLLTKNHNVLPPLGSATLSSSSSTILSSTEEPSEPSEPSEPKYPASTEQWDSEGLGNLLTYQSIATTTTTSSQLSADPDGHNNMVIVLDPAQRKEEEDEPPRYYSI